jgi:hypothetical protein
MNDLSDKAAAGMAKAMFLRNVRLIFLAAGGNAVL